MVVSVEVRDGYFDGHMEGMISWGVVFSGYVADFRWLMGGNYFGYFDFRLL